MKLTKIKQHTLTDRVEDQIKQAIADAKLIPGDKLPGELEFAAKLGVSRNIVREALSRLRMLDVVESRKNRGMILTEPRVFKRLGSIFELPILSDTSKNEFIQIRVICEIGMADLVFRRKTDADIAFLDAIVQREMAHPADLKINIDCDVAFHTRLFEIAGNQTLKDLHNILRPIMTAHAVRFQPDRFNRTDAVTHLHLFEALKADDANRYRELMRQHLLRLL